MSRRKKIKQKQIIVQDNKEAKKIFRVVVISTLALLALLFLVYQLSS